MARVPLPFAYESSGVETRFTNGLEPEPRSHPVYAFHRPETLAEWLAQRPEAGENPLMRARLLHMSPLPKFSLYECSCEEFTIWSQTRFRPQKRSR